MGKVHFASFEIKQVAPDVTFMNLLNKGAQQMLENNLNTEVIYVNEKGKELLAKELGITVEEMNEMSDHVFLTKFAGLPVTFIEGYHNVFELCGLSR